ncbi:glutathione S-transferase family protein [Trinickia mobilis]|uniref:glutathione S-transferase family protein n=1 Tax=Trinickia mobilis TaxID=2816356 RepID=UPI001A8DB8D7|nr:glutathione S-transferase family protein [Trinickia mobilis]
MLELYHIINSASSHKVRLALQEKGLEAKEHLMTLSGDQFDPAYMKLNPNAAVPTLVHDGYVVVESSVILHYLDEVFPEPALMPRDPKLRAKVRLYCKLIDEYVHSSCTILSFATCFRDRLLKLSDEEREAELAKTPIPKRADYLRDTAARGLESPYVVEAVKHYEKLLSWIDESARAGAYLAGEAYSLAEAAVIPYIARLELLGLDKMWANRPGVAAWWQRMRDRPSTEDTLWKRMTDGDWAPFKNASIDPWPKVSTLLAPAR